MRAFLRDRLTRRALQVLDARPPDVVIGHDGSPYLERWHVFRCRWLCNIYLHKFLRSDDDRALHDHPWACLSWILKGSYFEHTPDMIHFRDEGALVFRSPWAAHRIQLLLGGPDADARSGYEPVVTLFVTGPKIRAWGFHCPQGWRHWRDFTAGPNGETVGKGCE
jgi:hypothetical protein